MPERPPVPLFDLATQHRSIHNELLAAVAAVAKSQAFINGEAVRRFEQAFASWHGVDHAIGLSSGTDALLVSLMALGIKAGDEVITTPFTFIATAEVIRRLGARPVFVEIDPQTFLIRADAVADRISPRTRAVVPVHLFGRTCAIDPLQRLADRAGIAVIEDCAQATGARWAGRLVGTFGDFGAFSFFPTKNLGGWGDGGMLLCRDGELTAAIRALRDHGAGREEEHRLVGGNFRLDTLQAAVLMRKLEHVERWQRMRIEAAHRYHALFAERELTAAERSPVVLPALGEDGEHSFGLFVVRVAERDGLRAHLARLRIHTGVYYAKPLHLQPCFADLGYRPGDFPATERAAEEVLALPCFAGITPEQQRRVVDAMADFYRR